VDIVRIGRLGSGHFVQDSGTVVSVVGTDLRAAGLDLLEGAGTAAGTVVAAAVVLVETTVLERSCLDRRKDSLLDGNFFRLAHARSFDVLLWRLSPRECRRSVWAEFSARCPPGGIQYRRPNTPPTTPKHIFFFLDRN
jgi:hypothetical protein